MERIHEGILYQDQHKRYCLYEPGMPPHQRLTCTSGCRLEVWLNRTWIAGHVEGDGEDYWLFADGGGKFLLAERMNARYTEHHWRSDRRHISGICSSSSISLMVLNDIRIALTDNRTQIGYQPRFLWWSGRFQNTFKSGTIANGNQKDAPTRPRDTQRANRRVCKEEKNVPRFLGRTKDGFP